MEKIRINIAVIEPSDIVYEGLSNLILKLKNHYYLYRLNDFEELITTYKRISYNIVVINPIVTQNKETEFIKYKTNTPEILFVAMVYSFFTNDFLSKFDNVISIADDADIISKKINNLLIPLIGGEQNLEDLTQREVEVLTCLTKGQSNKEIAEDLNISIHTVISHRKNIIEKTGIKSLPGLTIYALSKHIIQLDASI